MPYDPPPSLGDLSLNQIAELAAQRKLPPVESWSPAKTGDSEMRISADGRWFHQGGEITRPAMVRAFSSLLRIEPDNSYWLVTPQEKLSIDVADVPFIAVEIQIRDGSIAFRLNTDDMVVTGRDHPIETRAFGGTPVPYLHVRAGLWARCARPVYYELAELALGTSPEKPGIWSEGDFFALDVTG
ncbi:MAG: DUF1285 domain-containing protein [Sphingomonadales bacterium]|nr:DUF1285 domain-containing protein [Sphingomonadales bacterium]MBK9003465.1 DUF1285 domain-containing protein [Sphingomonadales bacterium]MBK9268552.1 DUF1285 domain-containing protein [Sphingomonadales bacterium]MBP6434556.1 DUF1285 domain-containing protein [Sphingorhabdus sp.]